MAIKFWNALMQAFVGVFCLIIAYISKGTGNFFDIRMVRFAMYLCGVLLVFVGGTRAGEMFFKQRAEEKKQERRRR